MKNRFLALTFAALAISGQMYGIQESIEVKRNEESQKLPPMSIKIQREFSWLSYVMDNPNPLDIYGLTKDSKWLQIGTNATVTHTGFLDRADHFWRPSEEYLKQLVDNKIVDNIPHAESPITLLFDLYTKRERGKPIVIYKKDGEIHETSLENAIPDKSLQTGTWEPFDALGLDRVFGAQPTSDWTEPCPRPKRARLIPFGS